METLSIVATAGIGIMAVGLALSLKTLTRQIVYGN